ncbi:hypothetical protein Bca52824_093527 [Brassica carinata]|uniref:K Homology domain-containing protein n=1 Tax=Brassica carinata TaxID=52824 RepID=A0A8X7P5L7_BRACI|nr:hypothetical protein Bca52824_093527 [Brassica carinata]
MPAVTDSVKNGTLNVHENENLIRWGVSATALPNENSSAAERWPGWPGDCVFRVIIPVHKIGAITGRQGEFVRKLLQETRARIQVLGGPATTPDRLVIISGKEKPEANMSPAMDAVVRVFRRVSRLPDNNDDDVQNAGIASTQALTLIGKQGSVIKSIAENSGASVRILHEEETPCYAAKDERIVVLQGEAFKIVKALEAVLGHLRKFLVDHSVIPLFEKEHLARVSQLRQEDAALSDNKPSLHAEPSNVCVKVRTLISYAEDIIGAGGANITYIRWRSGVSVIVKEGPNPGELILVIKGTFSQVQIAQQLIQEFISKQKDPVSVSGGNARIYSTDNVPVQSPQLNNRQEPLSSSYMGIETGPKLREGRPTSEIAVAKTRFVGVQLGLEAEDRRRTEAEVAPSNGDRRDLCFAPSKGAKQTMQKVNASSLVLKIDSSVSVVAVIPILRDATGGVAGTGEKEAPRIWQLASLGIIPLCRVNAVTQCGIHVLSLSSRSPARTGEGLMSESNLIDGQ